MDFRWFLLFVKHKNLALKSFFNPCDSFINLAKQLLISNLPLPRNFHNIIVKLFHTRWQREKKWKAQIVSQVRYTDMRPRVIIRVKYYFVLHLVSYENFYKINDNMQYTVTPRFLKQIALSIYI